MYKMQEFLQDLVHVLIPAEKNRNIPHLLQTFSVAVIFMFAVALFVFAQNYLDIAQKFNLTATVYPAVLTDLTNEYRSEKGIAGLAWNETLANAANAKARDMMQKGYFAHTSPEGLTPWHWFAQEEYSFLYAGENLAVHFDDTEDVEDAWLNSPLHKANIVNPHFSEVGIAVLEGFFEGKNTTVVVEFFGTPAFVSAQKVATPQESELVSIKENIPQIKKPTVAGVSIENKKELAVATISETDSFVEVKTIEPVVILTSPLIETRQSTWYERFIFNPTETVRNIYLLLVGLILTAVVLLVGKEYQKHHRKHFIMGLMLIAVLTFFSYALIV